MYEISVVTPVLDAKSDFQATLQSLTSQTVDNVQWVVVDSSRDKSDIPLLIEDASNLHVHYTWVPPRGIFVAMNVGLQHSQGLYTYFLNAGDVLLFHNSLERVMSELVAFGKPAWAYADVVMSSDTGATFVPPPWHFESEKKRLFARGRFPCHQGTFVRTDVLRNLGGFNPEYKIASDYELFLKLASRYPHIHMKFAVARFAPGGTSSRFWIRSLSEFHQARRRVLAPAGNASIREAVDTAILGAKTLLYRTLWAPGRPLHRLVRLLAVHRQV